jgi:glycosyltransferase involved in cell wall biosynthesis
MRVGIDATGWANRRGYGRFARNVVRRLVDGERDPSTTYVLYVDEASVEGAELPAAAEIRRVRQRRAPAEAASADSSRSLRDLLRMTLAVREDELSVFLFPSLQTYFPVMRVPTLVGVHDAIPSELPQLSMPTARNRVLWRAKERFALRRARMIFTVSESARRAVSDHLGVSYDRLAVVPEAPDPAFRPRNDAEVAQARARVGLGPDEPYLLYAGGISPHKSVETLVEAVGLLEEPLRPRLVLVGDLETEVYVSSAASVRAAIARLQLERDVLLPGFVSDETLAALYSGAAAVVNPSLAEGFGLPAVEAAACEAPLVLSDLPAHHETLGDGAAYFAPRDANGLAVELRRLLTDEVAARALAARGRAAVAPLSWDVAADRLRDLLAETAG